MIEDWAFDFDGLDAGFAARSGELRDEYRDDVTMWDASVALLTSRDEWQVRVVWRAGACRQSPEVRTLGAGGRIDVIAIGVGAESPQGEDAVDASRRDQDIVVACPSTAPHFGVDLKTAAFLDGVTVVALDGYGDLVDDWAFHSDVGPLADSGDGVLYALVEPPVGWDVRIVWQAHDCQRRPYVTLNSTSFRQPSTSDSLDMAYDVHVDPGPLLVMAECDEAMVWRAIDLKTSTPVHDNLRMAVSEGWVPRRD